MNWYEKYMLPKLLHWACGTEPVLRQRQKVVPLARGRVLEIGIGSGLNLPFYDPAKVDRVWGLEPSAPMRTMAEKAATEVPFKVDFIELPGEEIPLESNSVDTVLVTYTLCTIPDVQQALAGMRRVLKPEGELLFCEHGLAPDENVRRWQERVDPLWQRIAGGCHLNRAIPSLIEQGGFTIKRLETMYLPGWKSATFNYWGAAVPR